jgi:hypothetical protein
LRVHALDPVMFPPIKTMFHYLSQLLFSEEPEDQELSDMGVGAGAEDINSEDGEVNESDSESDDELSESDDEGNVYYADSDSESEDEVCCQAVMSKLILCGADHTVLKAFWGSIKGECEDKGIIVVPKYVKACSRKDGIPCECFKDENVRESEVENGGADKEVCEPARKRSNSIH